jgi:hypothetical protein
MLLFFADFLSQKKKSKNMSDDIFNERFYFLSKIMCGLKSMITTDMTLFWDQLINSSQQLNEGCNYFKLVSK